LRRGLPLFAYLFLILASYVVGRVVRDSLFLSRFPATQLPYVDIVTAVAVAVVVAIYIRLCRGRSIRTLLLATTIVCALNCVVFWALARYYEPRWLRVSSRHLDLSASVGTMAWISLGAA
jgi:ATP/ADP translocase